MTTRDEILNRIDTIVPRRPASEVADAYSALRRPYQRRHHSAGILDLFAERVADYRAIVHRPSAQELPGALAAALSARSGMYVVPEGLPAEWTAAIDPGRLARGAWGVVPPPAEAQKAQEALTGDDPVSGLDAMAGVITGCAVAIAETGTIVLDHGPGQGPRAITLVPDHHLVVVTADQVAPDVPEALERLIATRPLTFISGSSATSDIELSRVEGVHGPRTLEVFLV